MQRLFLAYLDRFLEVGPRAKCGASVSVEDHASLLAVEALFVTQLRAEHKSTLGFGASPRLLVPALMPSWCRDQARESDRHSAARAASQRAGPGSPIGLDRSRTASPRPEDR